VGAFILASFLQEVDPALRWMLLSTGLATSVAAPVLRSLTRRTFARFSWWSQPLLIFGNEGAARRVGAYYSKSPGLGLRPVLVRPDLHENGGSDQSGVAALAARHRAVSAAVVLGGASSRQETDLLYECANTFPHLLIFPEMGGLLSTSTGVTDLSGLAGIRVAKRLLSPASRAAKRAMDLMLALLLSLICLPLSLILALAIKLTSPGPVFYGHERIGRGRKPFLAWKFRTMYANSDELLEEWLSSNDDAREEWARDQKLRNDPRLTRVGRVLRRTSLDELPQLWNVIRGEMSLVGPRPIVEEEVGKYGSEFGRYLSVPPGMTGLWQVSGRNRTTYEERIDLDTLYVEKWSPMLDAHILAKTAKVVVTGDGAY
jgi:Undecaprenyl-phosphate galactose phosphotransferase WbaP